jgi:putative DNA primase/helicase
LIDLNDAAIVQPTRYDLDEIVRRLREGAEHWVPRHFPNGRRNGDEWRLANIKGHAPRKNGSCVIALATEHAGDWIDFDGGDGGGPLSTLENATGLSGRELFAYAADVAGFRPGAQPERQAPTMPARSAAKDYSREIEFILSKATPIAGTPAERYLTARALPAPDSADLLFHPDLTHWESRRGFPGIVAIVRDHAGNRVALHRTYLADDGSAKAPLDNPRKMLGPVAGGAVRLAEIAGGVLGLAEGIETALAVMTACPQLPVWATLSASNLEQIVVPAKARRIVILADHDASRAGERAAEAAARRLAAEGRRVWIALPAREGEDFNDLLLRDGLDAVRIAVERAAEWAADAGRDDTVTETERGSQMPIGLSLAERRRPQLRADNGDLAHATRLAWEELLAANNPPWLFRSGGRPAWAVRDDDGLPMAQPLTEDRLRSVLAQLVDWRKLSRAGELIPAHPPAGVIKSVLATPDPSLPVLAGIATTPVFGRNGELITEPGYHSAARLLYDPPKGFVVPPLPEKPTPSDISAARAFLLDDLLGDFPFTSAAERAHALALLLVGFVRAMIDGPTPLHLIEKPTQGTGATLLVDAISVIATGHRASVMVEGSDDEEWRKRLTAKLRQIPSIVLIDNLRRPLDSSALAAALTAPFWEDRVLGISETTRLPIRCIWIATGNNPEFSGEMSRRLVRIRLDSRTDQPWRRDGFRHPNLMLWAQANRAHLVTACLTLCRAWIAAGTPRGAKTIGSFEDWAAVMGGMLEVIGVPDFLCNIDEMLEASDGEGAIWRVFVGQWWDRFGTAEVRTNDLYELALTCEPPLPLGTGGDHSRRIRLGKSLARMRDRVFDIAGLKTRVRALGVLHQARRWKLAVEGECGESGECFSRLPETQDGECRAVSDQHSHQHSPAQAIDGEGFGESGECGECFSDPYASARVHNNKEGDPDSPHPQHSPTLGNHSGNAGECGGECLERHSPRPGPPDWLKEAP